MSLIEMREMSKTNCVKCDHCGRVIEDEFSEIDWITIAPVLPINFSIRISGGRDESGTAKAKASCDALRLDFCDDHCFHNFVLTKINGQAEGD